MAPAATGVSSGAARQYAASDASAAATLAPHASAAPAAFARGSEDLASGWAADFVSSVGLVAPARGAGSLPSTSVALTSMVA